MESISKAVGKTLLDSLANPVSPELLRNDRYPAEFRRLFDLALRDYEGRRFKQSYKTFLQAHSCLGLPDRSTSAAQRNSWLALYQTGEYSQCLNEMMPWFKANSLYGAPLWNFSIVAIRNANYTIAIKAFEQWQQYPMDYLMPKCALLCSACSAMLGREPDSKSWLENARRQNPQYVELKLKQAGANLSSKPDEPKIDIGSRELLVNRLLSMLEPRGPVRYPALGNLAMDDFRRATEAIDFATDDNHLRALAALEGWSDDKSSSVVRVFIESSVRLQIGETSKAEKLIEAISTSCTMPGVIWWNWAVCAALRGDYTACQSRLIRSTYTEYATNKEAWVCLMLVSTLVGDFDTAQKAAVKSWHRSDRSRTLTADVLEGVDSTLVERLGITLVSEQPTIKEAVVEAVVDKLGLKSALKRSAYSEIRTELSAWSVNSIRELPEYVLMPLEPPIMTLVPRVLVRNNMHKVFKRGLQSLLAGDYADALGEFTTLADQFPHVGNVKSNLSSALFKSGRFIEALDLARQRADIAFENKAAYTTALIACLCALAKYREAEELIDKEKLELEAARVHLYRAVLSEDSQQARKLAEELCSLARTVNPSRQLLAYAALKCIDAGDNQRLKVIIDELTGVQESESKEKTFSSNPLSAMREKFRTFEEKQQWVRCEEYFSSMRAELERSYFVSGSKEELCLFVCASLCLAQALTSREKKSAAEGLVRHSLELMETRRDDLAPEVEGDFALMAAAIYKELDAPYRQIDALKLAQIASPKLVSNEVFDSIEIPGVEPELLGMAADDFRKAISGFLKAGTEEALSDCKTRTKDLFDILSKEWDGHLFSRSVKAVLCDKARITVEDARQTLERFKQAEYTLRTALPKKESELCVDTLQRLEDAFRETFQELTEAPISIRVVEANHDGTNATLVIECRSRKREALPNLQIKVESSKLLEFTHEQWDNVAVERQGGSGKRRQAGIRLEDLPPGARSFIPLNFGIVGQWSAEQTVVFRSTVVSNDGSEIAVDLSATFQPFEEPLVTYPNGAIGPADIEGESLYGRDDVVKRLSASLSSPRQTRLYFLFGPRKVGKTSIMKFVRAEVYRRAPKHLCVYVNLDGQWPENSPVKRISEEILRACRQAGLSTVGATGEQPRSMGELLDWIENLKALADLNHVVLMLDEFYCFVTYAASMGGSNLLGDLRHLWSGSQSLSLLLGDWHTLDEMSRLVPAQFWADIDEIPVRFLDASATRKAVNAPAKNSAVEFTEHAVEETIRLTNGYPWHVQQSCDYATRFSAAGLRHVILKSDITAAAQKLIEDSRTFKQGMFREDWISGVEEIILWRICRYTETEDSKLPVGFLEAAWPTLDRTDYDTALNTLILKSILFRDGPYVKLCSPLVYGWLQEQFRQGRRLSSELLPGGIVLPTLLGCVLDVDVEKQIAESIQALTQAKRKLRDACTILSIKCPFRFYDFTDEYEKASKRVKSLQDWDHFIGSLRRALIEDLSAPLNEYYNGPFWRLHRIVDSIRLRRNFFEHIENPARDQRNAELEHRRLDTCKDEPTSEIDWTKLQVGLLQRLVRELQIQESELRTESSVMLK